MIESGRGILGVSASQSQGFRALTVATRGYVRIQSEALSSLGARVGSAFHVDVWVPPEVDSIEPYYHGAVQLNFSIPSLAVYNDYLGQSELTPLPVGQWSTLTFTPTSQQVSKLSGSYSDLRFIIAINSPATDTTPYLNYRVDNLRVSDKTQALVMVVDKDGHAIPGAAVVAYNGDTATSNTAVADSAGLARVWVPVGHYRFAVTEAGATYFSAGSNQCHVPGLCVATTIVVKCHGVTCIAKDTCHAAGACDPNDGQCSNPPLAAGTVCRAAADACDLAEVCTGADAPCPADALAPPTTACRPAVGPCDLSESCTGNSAECPADGFVAAQTVCRVVAGACDVGEVCSGSNAACPNDGFLADGTICHDEDPITHGETCQTGACRPPVSSRDFICLLEGQSGNNELTMQDGGTTEQWQLRGTLKFRLEGGYATLMNANVEGFGTPNVADNNIFLLRHSGMGPGTFDEQTGTISVVLPFLFVRQEQPDSDLKMNLAGTLADRVLTGTADSVAGSLHIAHVDVFCREQFLDASLTVDYQFDETDHISIGDVHVGKGSPAIPAMRNGLTAGDFLFETRAGSGEVLDQFVVKKPVRMRDEPVAGVTFSLRMPLSNGIQTILVRDTGGQVVAQKDLASDIAFFCAGDGSQYCDLAAGRPVRKVFFTPNSPPPIIGLPAPASGSSNVVAPLPSSSRVFKDEVTVASTTDDRQPSVALDADGNAVVAWRRGYQDIMVTGLAMDNSVKFGPTVVNDKFCAIAWLPAQPPTSPLIKESATPYTSRPLVARVVGRNADGSADGTFVVAWGGLLPVAGLAPPPGTVDPGVVAVPIICARFFNSNGSPLTDPILVAPASNAPAEDLGTYFSIAIASSHKAVVAWHGASSSTYRAFARLIDPSQSNQPAAITVGSDSSAYSIYPTVSMDKNGQAVITWLKATSLTSGPNGLSGSLMFQRFDSDFTKRGGVVPGGSIAGIPNVAWSSASNTFLLAARRGAGEIWASTYAFDTGDRKGDWFRANARWNGRQHRPIVVPGAKGEFTVAWMDDVTLGSESGSVVTAQVFRADFVPEDIDFTVSTKTPIDINNVPDLLDMDGFGFSAGGSGDDNMAFVWQKANGISFQRVSGGAYTCPQPDDCKTAVPWRITGPSKDKLNVLVGPGNFLNPAGNPEGGTFSGELEFSRMAVEGVVNGLFVNDVIRMNAGKLNFFRGIETGEAAYTGACAAVSPYWGVPNQYEFLNVAGVLIKGPNVAPVGCAPFGNGKFGLITGGAWDVLVMSFMAHEFSHSAFHLSDEYDDCVNTSHWEDRQPALPNMYDSMEHCQSRSAHPADCRILPDCAERGQNWYRADRDEPVPDIMLGGQSTGFQYKEDCERNPKRIFGGKN